MGRTLVYFEKCCMALQCISHGSVRWLTVCSKKALFMPERVYVALDLETTGFDASQESIIEIGAVKFTSDRVLARFSSLVNPLRAIPPRITQITGIHDDDVAAAPTLDRLLPELRAFVSGEVSAVIAHNTTFDLGFCGQRVSIFNALPMIRSNLRPSCCLRQPATTWESSVSTWGSLWSMPTGLLTMPRRRAISFACCKNGRSHCPRRFYS